jgi:Condensation domain
MYYQHLLNKNNLAFNISIVVRIRRETDPDRISRTFQTLIDRHEGFRTSFILSNDGVIQKIKAKADFTLEILDPYQYETAEQAFHDFVRPFDLSLTPLVRGGLLQHKQKGNFLLVDIHHIIADGASLNILIDEFNRIYQGDQLPPLELRYVDYAGWINQVKGKLEQQKEFWSAQLAGDLPGLDAGHSKQG